MVRIAQTDDVDAVVRLYDAVNESYDAPGWGKGVYPTHETVKTAVDNEGLHIFINDGEVLGACILDHEQHPAYALQPWRVTAMDDDVFVVRDFVAHPGYRRRGIGSELLKYSINYARKRGAATIRLSTHATNLPARALYSACGFREISQWTGRAYDDLGIVMTFSVFEYIL